MDRNRMNDSYSRPYQTTCGMQCGRTASAFASGSGDCACIKKTRMSCPAQTRSEGSMYDSLQGLPLAMAYVPYQQFTQTFSLDYALQAGTIFPELCKPFCGKRGMKR